MAFTQIANGFLRAVWDRNARLVLGGAGGLVGLMALGRLGVLSIATAPFWARGLGRLLRWPRHAMAAGFRGTGE